MYHTESMFLVKLSIILFFFKIAIMYIQNHYFWLWWVDVSHRINVFGKTICRFGVRFGSQSGAKLVTKPFISRSLGRSVARSLGRSVTFRSEVMNSDSLHCKLGSLGRSVARSLGRSVTFRSEVMNSDSLHCKLGTTVRGYV